MKGRKNAKENCMPVSILPTMSKIYENSMLKQMASFFEDMFSKHQCGFRTSFSRQQCLLTLLEKKENAADKGKFCGALLTDLYMAFS